MSTLRVNTIQGLDAVERYLARAWVNFNGTGVVAIRAAGNVSSITDNGAGDYTVNFIAPMLDANYAAVMSARSAAAVTGYTPLDDSTARTVNAIRTYSFNSTSGAAVDSQYCNVAIFR